MQIVADKLKYSYKSIEPFIDEKTMFLHYNKHYKGYIEKFNKAIKNRENVHDNLEDIIKHISSYSKVVRNNAGGAYNHSLFWKMLSPKKIEIPEKLENQIAKKYGSLDGFKEKFLEMGLKSFGSGWIWLVLTKKNNLKIMFTPNQDNPLMNIFKNGGYPLLGLDLWEHAYYLKYKNDKEKYINNFWDSVNWNFVNEQYDKYYKGLTVKITESQLRFILNNIYK